MSVPHYFRHPRLVSLLLQLEGGAVLLAALVAYWQLGGNWWIFLLLCLAPDLSWFGFVAGQKTGATVYNTVHTYLTPTVIGLIAWFAGAHGILPYLVIWVAHIGADRALGYGLKYPDLVEQTHLGPIGKSAKTVA
jgi:hypothetical protein